MLTTTTSRTSKVLLAAFLLSLVSVGVAVAAGSVGITTRQVQTAAPGSINLSGVSASEGTSLAVCRADHGHSITGILPVANGGTGSSNFLGVGNVWTSSQNFGGGVAFGVGGSISGAGVAALTSATLTNPLPVSSGGTGAGVLNCAAGKGLTSNGSAFSCVFPILDTSEIVSGILGTTFGGTGVLAASANTVFAGPPSGLAASPGFRALVAADIPNAVTGPFMVAQFTLSGATTTVTGLPASGMVCVCSDVSASNALCKAPTSGTTMTITGTSGHLANIHCGPQQGTSTLSGGGF